MVQAERFSAAGAESAIPRLHAWRNQPLRSDGNHAGRFAVDCRCASIVPSNAAIPSIGVLRNLHENPTR